MKVRKILVGGGVNAAGGWRFEKSLAVNAEVVGDKYR